MLPEHEEVSRALTGAVRIAQRDPAAETWFNLTVEGFWRSFFALALALPLFALAIISEWQLLTDIGQAGRTTFTLFALGTMAVYVLDFLLFPAAMAVILPRMGLGSRYVPFIIAWNWSTLLVLAIFLPPYVLYGLRLLSVSAMAFLSVLASVVMLWYRWRLALLMLRTTAGRAAVVVLLSLGIKLLVRLMAQDIYDGAGGLDAGGG